ncbi:MAG: zf-HC2 domain-containing protein [Anaerolineales bacterium]|jgi:predicted anti-sigma-YlaC factor YlaD|nr:zf-HC2 domain-containing protein [Anaerolineales bacterium]
MTHNHEQCRSLLSSLSDYVDGSLEAVICAQIEEHMAECENCRIVVDTLRKTVNLYQMTNEPADVPEDVRERLYHSLDLDAFLNK